MSQPNRRELTSKHHRILIAVCDSGNPRYALAYAFDYLHKEIDATPEKNVESLIATLKERYPK